MTHDANGVMQAVYDPATQALRISGTGGSGAPTDATYITTTANGTLSAEQVLGTDVIMRGTAASKPAAGTAGRIYIETDGSLIIYRDSGSAWFEIARGQAGLQLTESQITGLVADLAAKQPLDSDLTAIAALTTTAFGRAFLELADAAAGRTALGLGTAATHAHGDYDLAGAAAAAQAASQPLDSDLTAIAVLTTTAYGRSLLEAANAAALRTLAGVAIGSDVQAYDAELAALAALTSAANKLPYFTGSGTAAVTDFTAAGRALIDDADAAAQRTTLGLGTASTHADTDYVHTTGDETVAGGKTFSSAPTLQVGALLAEGAAPATPAVGNVAEYAKSDHALYAQASDGVEVSVTDSPAELLFLVANYR